MDSVTVEPRRWGIWGTFAGDDMGWCGAGGTKLTRWFTEAEAKAKAAAWSRQTAACAASVAQPGRHMVYTARPMPAEVLPFPYQPARPRLVQEGQIT